MGGGPKLAASRLSLWATSKNGRDETSQLFFPLFSPLEIAEQINYWALENHGPSNLISQGGLGNLPRGWEAGFGDPAGPTECFLTKNYINQSDILPPPDGMETLGSSCRWFQLLLSLLYLLSPHASL